MIVLKEKEFSKLSEMIDLPVYDVERLYNMGLLNVSRAEEFLIKYDFDKVKSIGKYTNEQIQTALANVYNASKNTISNKAHRKQKKTYCCRECQKPIPTFQYNRYDGLCNECIAKTIKI